MNKRIKNKVTKRIINKMQTKKKLTDFEKRFFDKHLIDSFSDIAAEFLDNFLSVITRWLDIEKEKSKEAEAELEAQSMKENVNKLSAAEVEWFSRAEHAESSDITAHSVVEIEKESKWQKVKGKVKGWFGK